MAYDGLRGDCQHNRLTDKSADVCCATLFPIFSSVFIVSFVFYKENCIGAVGKLTVAGYFKRSMLGYRNQHQLLHFSLAYCALIVYFYLTINSVICCTFLHVCHILINWWFLYVNLSALYVTLLLTAVCKVTERARIMMKICPHSLFLFGP